MNFQPLKMLSPLLRMHAFTIWAWFYLKAFTLTVPSAPYSGLTLSPPPGLTKTVISSKSISWSLYLKEQLLGWPDGSVD